MPKLIGIGFYYHGGIRSEYPIWSDEDIEQGEEFVNKILESAKENNVHPEYYLDEFLHSGDSEKHVL